MEDKRDTKRPRSPSKEGSPSHSDTKTPPPVPSGSRPPPGSPSEISSRRPCSTVFEQGGLFKCYSGGFFSSSDEEGLIADVSRDEEFTRRLFGDLNRDVLGPLDYGKIIILSDSDEEEEDVHEKKTTNTEDAATSAAVNPASTASVNADDAPTGVKNNNSDDRTLD
jgi:hypothetical protein